MVVRYVKWYWVRVEGFKNECGQAASGSEVLAKLVSSWYSKEAGMSWDGNVDVDLVELAERL